MKPIIALILALTASTASAQTTGKSNLSNSATVLSSCSISVVNHINFGALDPLSDTTKTATGAFSVSCTKGSYEIQVGFGQNPYNTNRGLSSATCERYMVNSSGKLLQYSVSFLNASGNYTTYIPSLNYGPNNAACKSRYTRAGTWPGEAASGTSPGPTTLTFTESNKSQTVQMNGSVTANKTLTPGVYTDTISVGVVF